MCTHIVDCGSGMGCVVKCHFPDVHEHTHVCLSVVLLVTPCAHAQQR